MKLKTSFSNSKIRDLWGKNLEILGVFLKNVEILMREFEAIRTFQKLWYKIAGENNEEAKGRGCR